MEEEIKLLLDDEPLKGSSILYPSSCKYSDDFQDVPFDNVILCSGCHPVSKKDGRVYSLKCDNNALLGEFIRREIKLDTLVVINDGCNEGGNYECAARDGYLGRFLAAAKNSFTFITNHLSRKPRIPVGFKTIPIPDYLDVFLSSSDPVDRETLKCWQGTLINDSGIIRTIGNITVRIVRDTIWNHFRDYKLVYLPKYNGTVNDRPNRSMDYFNPWGDSEDCRRFLDNPPVKSILPCLEEAYRLKVDRIAFTPFAKGNYSKAIDEIRSWPHCFPKEIAFFHLHKNDFNSIKCAKGA